ncbi:MAG: glycosyltransferase family 9 protein [Rhodocyclaceae bacterium]|jgi:ADP-heptose:LPS heptosyltransferase|nr:glycosyltransferase family 9 protein [Rhodocyclaceae bacterium]
MKRLGEIFLHCACIAYRPFRRRNPVAPPRTFVVVSNTALGDTLLSTPVIASLRASFPAAHIFFVLHPRYASLFLGLDGIDGLLAYDGSYAGLPQAISRLRKIAPDVVLLAHSNGPQDIPLAWLAGAPLILKPATRSPFRAYLSAQMPPLTGHVIEERLNLVRFVGGTQITTRMQLPVRYSGDLPADVERLPQPTIGFQLGAANHYKQWPVGKFAALAKELLSANPEMNIVLTGSAGERALANELLRLCPDPRILDHTGKWKVDQLPWLLRQFTLLVTNDTGPMHLAIALGVPTVSLFGMTSASAIGPFQDLDRHIVIEKGVDRQAHLPKKRRSNQGMALIGVDEVFAAVNQQLSRHASASHH